MKIVLISIESSREPWFEALQLLYSDKIKRFISFERDIVKSSKTARDDDQFKRKEETEKILKRIKPTDVVYLLDERGKPFNSESFANQIEKELNRSNQRLVFVVGGAFGFTDELRKRANLQISLSPLVFNHLVAQAVLLEQIYRAFTIIKNLPYHNK